MTELRIDAPYGFRTRESETSVHHAALVESVRWHITWDDDGVLDTGETSHGILPTSPAEPTHKDVVLLALAKEVHSLREQLAGRPQPSASVSDDGATVLIGAYQIHGDNPGRVTLNGGGAPSFDPGSASDALRQAAREIRRLRGAPAPALTRDDFELRA